ncbi:MAG TPA: site-2 protease family protein [Dongiaceae bacterium]|nr:site-2 protease family protein [Dongiaceae bacterium]
MHVDHVTIVFFTALIVAIILHEISHGVVAYSLGDDTAKRAGRLTLNPIPHVDPFGSIFLPVLGALTHVPVIGWAKPVPVNPAQLRNRRRDMLIVSLAGPMTNFLLAAMGALIARWQFHSISGVYETLGDLPMRVLIPLLFAEVNLFLGIFNFLPIPPLDGASLVERALPERWLPGWYKFRPYGILVLFLLVFSTNVLSNLFQPFLDHLYRFVL